MNPDSSRRVWVKRFVLGTAASFALPRWTGLLLAETMPGSATVKLNVANYPNLEAPGGSIQISFNDLAAPFTLNRISPEEFVTLDSICTHQGCTVGPFVGGQQNCMLCPCHFSRYDLEGRVFRNGSGASSEPAPNDLNRFDTSFDQASNTVSVTIPNLALGIGSIQVVPQATAGNLKVHLRFPVTAWSTYEISHQTSLEGGATVVPFTTTLDGGDPQTSIMPSESGFITVYIDASGPKGFYSVGLVMNEV